jgi:hypothetical protein
MLVRPAARFRFLGCVVFLIVFAFPLAGSASARQMEMGNPSGGSASMDMEDTANCCPDMDMNGSRACPYLSPCHISTGSRTASGVSAYITALKPEFRIRLSPTHPSSRLVSQTQGLGPPGAAILFCNLRT